MRSSLQATSSGLRNSRVRTACSRAACCMSKLRMARWRSLSAIGSCACLRENFACAVRKSLPRSMNHWRNRLRAVADDYGSHHQRQSHDLHCRLERSRSWPDGSVDHAACSRHETGTGTGFEEGGGDALSVRLRLREGLRL